MILPSQALLKIMHTLCTVLSPPKGATTGRDACMILESGSAGKIMHAG
jgi:hypothetical protein